MYIQNNFSLLLLLYLSDWDNSVRFYNLFKLNILVVIMPMAIKAIYIETNELISNISITIITALEKNTAWICSQLLTISVGI